MVMVTAATVTMTGRQEEEGKAEEPSTPEKVDVDLDNHDLDEVRYHQFSKSCQICTGWNSHFCKNF